MGLLDIGEDPLMGLATGLLSASGPSRMPVSFGQALGAGVQGMNEYRQQGIQNKLTDFKMQQMKQAQEAATSQAAFKAKFLADPRIPEHIRNGVAAGAIDLADLMKPQKMGEGDTLVSPIDKMFGGTGVIAQGAPKAPKMSIVSIHTPKGWQDYQAADGVPDFSKPHGIPYRKGKEAAEISQHISNVAETEQSKAWGKTLGEIRSGMATAAFNAPSKLAQLDRMEQLLAGVEGGKLAPVGMEIASTANSMGIKIDPKLGNKEAAEALSREIAGSFRAPGTGPMTDKDFDNFLKRVPDLSKTAQGRAEILKTMRSALKRDMEMHKIVSNYAKKRNGNIDDGVLEELSSYVAANPVITATGGDIRAQADAIIGK